MKRWNIFARELEDILTAHGLELRHLDDRAHIPRAKVRRLSQSLLRVKSFPVLNPDEVDKVITVFGLSEQEVLRLRAAVLTTAIEETLMDRINQDDALKAAEQLFPIILLTMRKDRGDMGRLDRTRGGDTLMLEGTDVDISLEAALLAIDRATKALHLSYNVSLYTERLERARSALAGFQMAQAELQEVEDEVKVTQVWREWLDDTQKGIRAARERLEELGG